MDIARNDNGLLFTNGQAEFATLLSHVSHNSIPFLLVLYFLSLTGLWHGLKKRDFILLSIPEMILIVVHLIPPVKHMIYYYRGNLAYVRGPLYVLYYFIVAFYVVYGVVLLICKRASVEKRNIVYANILCGGYIVGMLLGVANRYLRITNFIQMVSLIVSFYLLEKDETLLDQTTGVYNVNALERDTYPLFHSSYTSYVLSIKLQDLSNYYLMIGMDAMKVVLHEMGEWMLGFANENCHFYSVAPGNFTVLIFNADQKKADAAAKAIHNRFSQSWIYSEDGTGLTIPAQIWISSIPDRISTAEQVMAFSEASFNVNYPVDQIIVADEMKDERRRMQVNLAIRRALNHNTFEVYYQPICDTKDNRIHSCEALVRMTDPELGPVSPEEFIKVAEQTGAISRIDAIVFEKVCAFLAEQKPEQYGMNFVEINLSPIQCMDLNLVSELESVMKKYGVSVNQIMLGITESAVIQNKARVSSVIQNLKDAGFRFALDDFGTGQANYSYVREFPFSIIKIDKSFLWSADQNPEDRAVLHNMLNLVKDLNLQSVVEGVETEEQKGRMVKEGVDYLQGYYYSRPVPEDAFIAYIREFNSMQ